MPEILINATLDYTDGRIDEETYRKRIEVRRAHQGRPKEALDADGHQRLLCPAAPARPTARCELKPKSNVIDPKDLRVRVRPWQRLPIANRADRGVRRSRSRDGWTTSTRQGPAVELRLTSRFSGEPRLTPLVSTRPEKAPTTATRDLSGIVTAESRPNERTPDGAVPVPVAGRQPPRTPVCRHDWRSYVETPSESTQLRGRAVSGGGRSERGAEYVAGARDQQIEGRRGELAVAQRGDGVRAGEGR
jgi:hypothetical protein